MDVNVDKFPLVLREKIKSGEVVLPSNIEIEYTPIKVYRKVLRSNDDMYDINREDFMSYAELGKKPPRNLKLGVNDPDYYSTSFYSSFDALKNHFTFPHPTNKVVVGDAYCQGGPCMRNELTKHVSWWMYEDANIFSFEFLEENNE